MPRLWTTEDHRWAPGSAIRSRTSEDNPDITDCYGYGELSTLDRWRGNSFTASLRGKAGRHATRQFTPGGAGMFGGGMPCGRVSAGGATLTGGPGAIGPGGTPGAVPGAAMLPRGGTICGAGMRDGEPPEARPAGGGVFGGGIAGAA